ncbi:hypothetical protein KM043_018626 [Ampulex compressa]|nr:hypothetical protein KM043_018626 [Ampulex compressa]
MDTISSLSQFTLCSKYPTDSSDNERFLRIIVGVEECRRQISLAYWFDDNVRLEGDWSKQKDRMPGRGAKARLKVRKIKHPRIFKLGRPTSEQKIQWKSDSIRDVTWLSMGRDVYHGAHICLCFLSDNEEQPKYPRVVEHREIFSVKRPSAFLPTVLKYVFRSGI